MRFFFKLFFALFLRAFFVFFHVIKSCSSNEPFLSRSARLAFRLNPFQDMRAIEVRFMMEVRDVIMIISDDLIYDDLYFTITIVIFWLMKFVGRVQLLRCFFWCIFCVIFFILLVPFVLFFFATNLLTVTVRDRRSKGPLNGLQTDFENEFSIWDYQALVSLKINPHFEIPIFC